MMVFMLFMVAAVGFSSAFALLEEDDSGDNTLVEIHCVRPARIGMINATESLNPGASIRLMPPRKLFNAITSSAVELITPLRSGNASASFVHSDLSN